MYANFSVLVVLLLVPLGKAAFDCNNRGEDVCLNSAKCQHFGDCMCLPGFIDHQCKVHRDSITNGTACTVSCQNGGTCYYGNKCSCPYDFVGDLCEKQRTGVQCKFGEIEVVAYRNFAFNGEVYIFGLPKCKLTKDTSSDVKGMHRYSLSIDLFNPTAPCMPKPVKNATSGITTYTMDLATAYYPVQYSDKDTYSRHSCAYDPVVEKPGTTVETSDSLVDLAAMDPKTNQSVKVQVENSTVILVFAPTHVKDVKGVLVDFLEIYSYSNTIPIVTREIVKNGCVNESLQPTIGPLKSYTALKDGVHVAMVQLKSFILIDGQPLLFDYRLKLCPDACPVPACPPPTPAPVVG